MESFYSIPETLDPSGPLSSLFEAIDSISFRFRGIAIQKGISYLEGFLFKGESLLQTAYYSESVMNRLLLNRLTGIRGNIGFVVNIIGFVAYIRTTNKPLKNPLLLIADLSVIVGSVISRQRLCVFMSHLR